MSENYVKKYDVGQIKLDLPYANFIHELPLLSFGDVLHTVNLNLVFNYERYNTENASDNPFFIAPGYKLNLQKRILIDGNNQPAEFQEENGKTVGLTSFGDVFTFNDDSQRILRRTVISSSNPNSGSSTLPARPNPNGSITPVDPITLYEYTVEYPDYSIEKYNTSGRIVDVYDKNNNHLLTYTYNFSGMLSKIKYGDFNDISLKYNSNQLESITYEGCKSSFFYNNDKTLRYIEHYSEVYYTFDYSSDYSIQAANAVGATAVNSQSLCKNIGDQTISISDHFNNTVTYCFYNSIEPTEKNHTVDITDNNEVKTRVTFNAEGKPLYSYEIGNGDMFDYKGFSRNVQIYRTLNDFENNQFSGILGRYDGNNLSPEEERDGRLKFYYPIASTFKGYYLITGWCKPKNDTPKSDENRICISTTGLGTNEEFYANITPRNEWNFFAYKFYPNTNYNYVDIYPYSSNDLELKDVRLTYQVTHEWNENRFSRVNLSEYVLLNEDDEMSFNNAAFRYSKNNGEIDIGNITPSDVMLYKLKKKKNGTCTEVYYNNCKSIVKGCQDLKVLYQGNYVSISNFDLGIKTYSNKNISCTRIAIGDNNPGGNITKTHSVNGVVVSTENLNSKLDLMQANTQGIVTYYNRNSNGLITSKEVMGLNQIYIDYTSNLITVREINGTTVSITKYYLNSTWGGVYKIEVLDENNDVQSVVEDIYDSDMGVLTEKHFDTNNPKIHTFGYLNGKISSLNGNGLEYAFNYNTSNGELEKVIIPSGTVEHHTYGTSDNNQTIVESYYPSSANAIYTTTNVFDRYGRLKAISGILENEYGMDPYWFYLKDERIHDDIESYDRAQHGELLRGTTGIDGKDALLASTRDYLTNEITEYGYDHGKLTAITVRDIANDENETTAPSKYEIFAYDSYNRLTKDTCTYDVPHSKSVESVISYITENDDYDADNRISNYEYKINNNNNNNNDGDDNNDNITANTANTFDNYRRISNKTHTIGDKVFAKAIEYSMTKPQSLFDSAGGTISYTYDNMGRIESMTVGGNTTYYTYDEYGQLIREDKNALDKTFQYVYNGIGNLDSVITYSHVNGVPSANGTTNTLQYNDTSHPDRLTKCGYKNIGYNAIGYPVTYGSMHFDWENGKLAKYYEEEDPDGIMSSESTEFTYNAFGQRVRKEYSYYPGVDYSGDFTIGKEVNYDYDHSGRLIREISTEYFTESASVTQELMFLYDESGMIGFTHSRNGSTPLAYYYQRNLQGDVVAIYNTDGAKVASYAYDAWGNCTASGNMAPINPIRYRGYYWDSETNWYYLNARYYSPEFRRFISPDDTSYLDPESVNGLNLYCYCGNDPINFVDPSGHWLMTVLDWLSAGTSIIEVVINPSDPLAWAGLAGDLFDLLPFVTGTGEAMKGMRIVKKGVDVADSTLTTIRITKAVDFTEDAANAIRDLDKVGDFTKSSRSAGIRIHKGYKTFNKKLKEYGKFPGIRLDFFDDIANTIYELKPYNPNSIKAGVKQLGRYRLTIGEGYTFILELY